MKKTVITPNSSLNQKITLQCGDGDAYAKKIVALPTEKKSHKVTWIVSTLAACLMVAVGLGLFLKTPKTPWYNELVVGDELFENYVPKNYGNILSSGGNRFYPEYDDVDKYISDADLVIIGYPENTFTDEQKAPYSREGKFAGEGEEWYTLDTIRKIRVLDVLKGDTNLKNINLHVKEATMPQEDGSIKIEDTSEFHFIQKQNVKYMFILSKSAEYNGEPTYYATFDSVINVDGLHTESLDEVTAEFFKGVMDKYAEYFEKYNRSAEAEVTEEKALAYAEDAKYFKNEAEAYEYSDLVIIGSPKNEFVDDRLVGIDGKLLMTDYEVKEYYRNEVFTLRENDVLAVLKGDENISTVYIPNGTHYYYDQYTKAKREVYVHFEQKRRV